MWNSKSNYVGWKLYLGDLFETDNVPVYASPARATDLSNLPPTLSFVGDLDPFYDETVIFMDRLRKNGIPVYFEVYKGCFHAFDLLGEKTKIGKEAVSFLLENFKYAVNHYFAEQPYLPPPSIV
jgi:acetyl esterase/lipase